MEVDRILAVLQLGGFAVGIIWFIQSLKNSNDNLRLELSHLSSVLHDLKKTLAEQGKSLIEIEKRVILIEKVKD